MTTNLGAVGDRGPHLGGSGTGFTVRGIGRRRSCLRFVAAAASGLIVTVAAVACLSISPGVPEIAKSSSNPWTISTIDSSGGGGTSIALDSVGKVHVIYMSGEGLKYATNTEGPWVTSTVVRRVCGIPRSRSIPTTRPISATTSIRTIAVLSTLRMPAVLGQTTQ